MKKVIALSQRVDILPSRNERCDSLDQRWHKFLDRCGFIAVPIPNYAARVSDLLSALRPVGIILTGGNDLVDLGGDAPERDVAEHAMLDWASKCDVPTMGVCRGMQMILHTHGAPLKPATGHAGVRHQIDWEGHSISVNSYHNWGLDTVPAEFEATAHSDDGSIEATRHRSKPLSGIMWHPEREDSIAEHDLVLFRTTFGKAP